MYTNLQIKIRQKHFELYKIGTKIAIMKTADTDWVPVVTTFNIPLSYISNMH